MAGAALVAASYYAADVATNNRWTYPGYAAAHREEPPKARSMVRLSIMPKGGICSGVHVGSGYVLTAAHCTDGQVLATDENGFTWAMPTDLMWVSKDYDIALYHIDGLETGVEASPISCRLAGIGEEVEVAGNPIALPFVHTFGRVAAKPWGSEVLKDSRWKTLLPIDVTGGPGNSGGPVYDMRGHVVGIVVAGLFSVPARSLMFAVPADAICKLIPFNS